MRRTYEQVLSWKRYQPFLPEIMKLDHTPEEQWWEWRGNSVHLDRMSRPESPIKVIVLHGGGGNGRLVSIFGTLVHKMGYEYVAPDLPGFGLTECHEGFDYNYKNWVELVSDLVDREIERDGRPVVLFGGSLGGMLCYHAACINDQIKGIIATTLANPRDPEVRDALAKSKIWSRLGAALMQKLPSLADHMTVRVSDISKLHGMANDPALSKVFIDDELVGRARVRLSFYRTLSEYEAEIEPNEFRRCPILLVHPADDRWTPYSVSQVFFERLAGPKTLVHLDGCAHMPYEEPGLTQMNEAIGKFLKEITKT